MESREKKPTLGIILAILLVVALSIGVGYFNLNYNLTVSVTKKENEEDKINIGHFSSFDFRKENIRDHITIDSSIPNNYEKKKHDDNEAIGNSEAKKCSILFAGDIFLAPNIVREYTYGGGLYTILDDIFISAIDKSDYFVANLETCITDRNTFDVKKEYSLKQSPDELHVLDSLGVNLFATANNHAMDFGHDALVDTWQYLDYIGKHTFGSGPNKEEARKPFIITINGVRLAFFNATSVVPKDDWKATDKTPGITYLIDPYEYIIPEIRRLKDENIIDKAIVFLHWGKELEEQPNKMQVECAHSFVRGGADLVVGAHPHIPQTIEYYEGKPIVYSLGNFVFGKNILKQLALVQIEFDLENNGTKLKVIPGTGWWNTTKAYRFEERQFCFDKYIEKSLGKLIFDNDGYVYDRSMLSTPSIAQIEKSING